MPCAALDCMASSKNLCSHGTHYRAFACSLHAWCMQLPLLHGLVLQRLHCLVCAQLHACLLHCNTGAGAAKLQLQHLSVLLLWSCCCCHNHLSLLLLPILRCCCQCCRCHCCCRAADTVMHRLSYLLLLLLPLPLLLLLWALMHIPAPAQFLMCTHGMPLGSATSAVTCLLWPNCSSTDTNCRKTPRCQPPTVRAHLEQRGTQLCDAIIRLLRLL